jgi:hypothetical protein
MEQQLEKRLAELKSEFEAGQKMLADMDIKRKELEDTMLRISGAIQVIEEMLASRPAQDGPKPEE